MPRRRNIERKLAKPFVMPLHVQQGRIPEGHSPLLDFIMSCNGEVGTEEAIREYQQEWCDHPRKKQKVLTMISFPTEERFEHEIVCQECGLIRQRKGRAPNA